MKRVSFYPWFLSTLIYVIGIYFGFNDLRSYFDKYIIGTENMTGFQTKYLIALSVACLLATYNYVGYSKRYFKTLTSKSKRR